jgi:hypothetical protein
VKFLSHHSGGEKEFSGNPGRMNDSAALLHRS